MGAIEIDGAAGGGQVLRTALSLAAVTGRRVRVDDVRGARPNPGLRPQHLAAVDLVAAACEADVEGAEPDSRTVTFAPGAVRGGDLARDVGTAGSVALVFDALLPLAAALDTPLSVEATGGTDVAWSPPIEYPRRVKIPLLRGYGLDASVDCERTGFYPAGGGRATLELRPSTLAPLRLTERGSLRRVAVYSKASASLEDAEVADRQAAAAVDTLDAAGRPVEVDRVEYVASDCPGSSILLVGEYERTRVGASALGERGKPSEAVAADAASAFEALHDAGAVMDPHLADQALVALALSGGELAIPHVTGHVRTNLAAIRAFGCDATLDERPDGTARVRVEAPLTPRGGTSPRSG
ncbi:RNA 3'-terminal phosphate cyclase [Halomarina halobia]|uniref:RNA 3'-terminal phosphate cyclase n=1 Tax=Halomarina halobia TaxID=3033386 RepID=A0ABD6A583_9EURY|nr:RNA 3'-terminal phosphate cyclase [Halomarina sp. PSR21]